MVNSEMINENIILPMVANPMPKNRLSLISQLQYQIIFSHNIIKTKDVSQIVEVITSGDTALFIEGIAECLLIETKKFETS